MGSLLAEFNYVDIIIIFVLFFFVVEGFRHGFLVMVADFLSFFLSLLISLRTYQLVARLLANSFNLISSMANSLAFILTAVIAESILGLLLGLMIARVPKKFSKAKINKYLSIIPALGEALVIVSFILTLVLSFPLPPKVKADISTSRIGSEIVDRTQGVEKTMKQVFGGVIEDSLTYLIVEPDSTKKVVLQAPAEKLTVDSESEGLMFKLVNEERSKNGAGTLVWDPAIVPVARTYATDMWQRKYFGHYSPEGEDVGDRLQKEGIEYFVAGENLALAPTVQTAMTGLMNSEGHRRNILDPNFEKVGIGVVDNGVYGKIFVQIFIK